jgi:hypothetical protein
MSKYILNKNKQDSKTGENYEIHNVDTCGYLPDYENRLDVGYFSDCHSAKAEAKRKYPSMSEDIDGCYHCCYPCHQE